MVNVTSIRPYNYNIAFNGRIIDSHTHLGKMDNRSYEPDSLTKFHKKQTDNPDEDYVDTFVTSALDGMCRKSDGKYVSNEIEANKNLINTIKSANAQNIIKPLAVCQVDSGNAKNIEKLFDEGDKFYGLKFHPMETQINADDERYNPYMKIAQKRHLPCVFHTETTDGYAAPKRIYELAKRTPEVPVVLYHMCLVPAKSVKDLPEEEIQARGLQNDRDKWCWDVRESWNREGIDVVEQAIKNKDANLYLETSWTKPETMIEAIKRVGADRVLWGTDAPIGDSGENATKENYFANVDKYKAAIKEAFPENAQEIEDQVFFKNAERLFGNKSKKISNNDKAIETVGYAASLAVGIGALTAFIKNISQKKNNKIQFQDNLQLNEKPHKESILQRIIHKFVKKL